MAPIVLRKGRSVALLAVGVGLLAASLRYAETLAYMVSHRQQTFQWMQWVPEQDSPLIPVLRANFRDALPVGAIVPSLKRWLVPLGIQPGNTLFGHSVCSDEINHGPEDVTREMIRYWGNVFPLGGIGGAPFVGKTGFGAFSGHVPDGGHIFILFGPHVGISPDGQVGLYHRKGQSKPSGACGALIGGYKMLSSGTRIAADDMNDIEEAWLCSKLAPHVENITAADNSMAELVKVAYHVIEEEILRITHTRFGNGNLVLLGGIQINMPEPYQDHFLPMHFSVNGAGKPQVDLLKVFFGDF